MAQKDSGPEMFQWAAEGGSNGAGSANHTMQANFGPLPGAQTKSGAANDSGPVNNSYMPALPVDLEEAPQYRSLSKTSQSYKKRVEKGAADTNTIEYFRRIYLSLQTDNSLDAIPTIGVTSAVDGEGKSTIALGVATAMAADMDSPIVLVELNLTRPSVHKTLGIPARPGLSEYLRGECPLPTALRQITENLFVLPAGDCQDNPTRLVRMLTRANLLLRMDNSGARIVLDLPAILTSSYGVLVSSMADAVVMVVRSGHTPEKMVKDALARLDESTLRGIVLNAARPSIPTWLGGYV